MRTGFSGKTVRHLRNAANSIDMECGDEGARVAYRLILAMANVAESGEPYWPQLAGHAAEMVTLATKAMNREKN